MGLGRLFTRTSGSGTRHARMLVSDGIRIGPAAGIAGDTWWGHGGFLRALGIPGVDRAVRLISSVVGGLPWDAYTDGAADFAQKVAPRPILLEQPNPEEVRMASFSNWTADYLLHGNAVGVIAERDGAGVPTAIVPVPARMVGIRRADGQTYSVLPTGAIEYSIGGRVFSAHDVLHVKGLAEPGALRGLGVLEAHLHGDGALGLAEELARQARNISQDGVPTGVLKATSPDVTPDQLREAKALWLETQRDRTIAALAPSTDFEPLAWDPEKLQLIEARKLSLLEVANVFGLPPRYLGASSGDSMTYSNGETEAIDLMKFSVGEHVARFEQTLTLLFPPGTWVTAKLDAILRADTAARYTAHETGIRAGFLLKSEARALENLPPVDGIDDEPAQQQSPPHATVLPLPTGSQSPQEEAS
ncbi:phage portal protein [Amycolatopsis jiangsuensis]|uniref:HK97 family phage portal protein n=1 Tax=Amycolatopsis jiangsuensis TaxID=1181879 RepID=A0A840J7X8_9PSEU|nr:phage portal protein [Amycolatopsis jiangsuensis]MBB4689819.1 HK97 family phage portal protein [Amycolatopsis jiangsuensis]